MDGQGIFTWYKGIKRVGEFKKGKLWNITEYGKKGNILRKWVNGVKVVDKKKEQFLYLRKENGEWLWSEKGNENNDGKYVGIINENGLPSEAGIITFPNGDKYEGELNGGIIHGHGTFTWSDGNMYIGEWKDEKRHGQGAYIYSNGNKFTGEWKVGKKHGQGTFTWSNGDKYEGEWKDGKKNGKGLFTWA